MNSKYLLLIPILIFNVGCSDLNIDAVKESLFIADESYTVGQALENRPLCDEVVWSSLDDSRGRSTVEYRCSINKSADYFSGNKNQVKQFIDNGHLTRIKDREKRVVEHQEYLKAALESVSKLTAEIKSFSPEKGKIDISVYRHTKSLTSKFNGFSWCNYDLYGAAELSRLEKCMTKTITQAKKDGAMYKRNLSELRQSLAAKRAANNIAKATEIFRWAVDSESIHYEYGGLEFEIEDREPITQDYMRSGGDFSYSMKRALADTLNQNYINYETYQKSRTHIPSLGEIIKGV